MKEEPFAADFAAALAALLADALTSDELAALAALDTEGSPVLFRIVSGQVDDDFTRPCCVVTCKTRALDAHGTCLAYTLSADVQSDAEERDAAGAHAATAQHAARVETVRSLIFGATPADAHDAADALTAALENLGRFTLAGYDATPDPSAAGVSASAFSTPILVSGVATAL